MEEIAKIPSLNELVSGEDYEQNGLTVLLNQNPPKDWLKQHPFISMKNDKGQRVPYFYIPKERIEYMLTRIFNRWWVEVKDVKLIANSVVTTIRLFVVNPVSGVEEWQDGLGASPIQTDKESGAIDFNNMKAGAIQMAAPASETYAIKDAAEKFGKLFGKDLNLNDISYNNLLKVKPDLEELKQLFDIKKEHLTAEDCTRAEAIIDGKESASYSKLINFLKQA